MSQLNFTSDLHEDAKNGNLVRVKRALDRGTPVNARKEGYTALHRACQSGQVPVVKLLIERGADTNARTFGYYGPIHWAASGGFKEVIEILLQSGADPTAPLQNGKLAHELAQEEGHSELSEWLKQVYTEALKNNNATVVFEHETLRQQASAHSSVSNSFNLSDELPTSPSPSNVPPAASPSTSSESSSPGPTPISSLTSSLSADQTKSAPTVSSLSSSYSVPTHIPPMKSSTGPRERHGSLSGSEPLKLSSASVPLSEKEADDDEKKAAISFSPETKRSSSSKSPSKSRSIDNLSSLNPHSSSASSASSSPETSMGERSTSGNIRSSFKSKSPFTRKRTAMTTHGSAIVRGSRDEVPERSKDDSSTPSHHSSESVSLPVLPRDVIDEEDEMGSKPPKSPRPKFAKFWKKRTS